MPTYPYSCKDCGHAFEIVQSFSDDALTECPECGGNLRKVFSSVGVVFKGSGFYRNDSRNAGKTAPGSGSAGASDGASSSSATSSEGSSGGSSAGSSGSTSTAGTSSTSGGSGGSGTSVSAGSTPSTASSTAS